MDSARACLLQLDTVVAKSGVLETGGVRRGRGRDRCLTTMSPHDGLDDAQLEPRYDARYNESFLIHGMMPAITNQF